MKFLGEGGEVLAAGAGERVEGAEGEGAREAGTGTGTPGAETVEGPREAPSATGRPGATGAETGTRGKEEERRVVRSLAERAWMGRGP